MLKQSSLMAELFFQAAVAVGHQAVNGIPKSLHEASLRVGRMPKDLDVEHCRRECFSLVSTLFGFPVDDNFLYRVINTGRSGQVKILLERDLMVTVLLFCYEYCVSELRGDRVEIPKL